MCLLQGTLHNPCVPAGILIEMYLLCAAGKKEIVTGSLDKTIVLWKLEVGF